MTDTPTTSPSPRTTPLPGPAGASARTRCRRGLLAALRFLGLAACGGAAEALTAWLLQR